MHHDTSYSEERKRLNGNESVISLKINKKNTFLDLYCLRFPLLIGVDY